MKITLAALISLLAVAVASASPMGFLVLGSSGTLEATITSINWTPDPSALPVPGPPWNADVSTGTNLTFAGGPLMNREGVLINGGTPFGSPPPPGAGVVNPFLQFEAHPNLLFNLAGVAPGSANTNCALAVSSGESCSILVAGLTSPVVLTNNGLGGTNAAITFLGTATDGVGIDSPWVGGFSATIQHMTPFAIAQFFCGADGICSPGEVGGSPTLRDLSVSGSFTATIVPEPVSLVLAGVGLLAIGVLRRRKPAMRG